MGQAYPCTAPPSNSREADEILLAALQRRIAEGRVMQETVGHLRCVVRGLQCSLRRLEARLEEHFDALIDIETHVDDWSQYYLVQDSSTTVVDIEQTADPQDDEMVVTAELTPGPQNHEISLFVLQATENSDNDSLPPLVSSSE